MSLRHHKFFSFFSIILVLMTSLSAVTTSDRSLEIEFIQQENKCLEVLSHKVSVTFVEVKCVNRCNEEANATVCALFSNGKSVLKKRYKIPRGGTWLINIPTPIGKNVEKIEIISGKGVLPPSSICGS